MNFFGVFGGGNGLVDWFIFCMFDFKEFFGYWEMVFDRKKVCDSKVFIFEWGIEEDYDNSEDELNCIKEELVQLFEK